MRTQSVRQQVHRALIMQNGGPSIVWNSAQDTCPFPLGKSSREVFDLAAVVADFCQWYSRLLRDNNLQGATRTSPNIPKYVHGSQVLIKKMLTDTARNSLLCAVEGAISVQVDVDVRQHTWRRYSLGVAFMCAEGSISPAQKKDIFHAGVTSPKKEGFLLRSTNLYYARMIAQRLGGDVRIDSSARFGVRFLVEVSLFCPVS